MKLPLPFSASPAIIGLEPNSTHPPPSITLVECALHVLCVCADGLGGVYLPLHRPLHWLLVPTPAHPKRGRMCVKLWKQRQHPGMCHHHWDLPLPSLETTPALSASNANPPPLNLCHHSWSSVASGNHCHVHTASNHLHQWPCTLVGCLLWCHSKCTIGFGYYFFL